MAIDLSKLPAPQSINIPNFEDLFQENLGIFLSQNPSYSVLTEADPIVKLIQTWTYRELILRFLLNDVAASNLLPLATEGDLDYICAFYNVERLVIQEENLETIPTQEKIMESDDDLRQRTLDRIGGWANAGGVDHYKYWAKTSSSKVKDAAVYCITPGLVNIAILSRDADGIPTQDVLDTVTQAINRTDIKVLTDTVVVAAARKITATINATIILESDTPIALYNSMADTFQTEFNKSVSLGWDLTESWVKKVLHQEGVYKVVLTSLTSGTDLTKVEDIIVKDDEYCSYLINLTNGGRNK